MQIEFMFVFDDDFSRQIVYPEVDVGEDEMNHAQPHQRLMLRYFDLQLLVLLCDL